MDWYIDMWRWAADGGAAHLFVIGAAHLLALALFVRTVESLTGKRIPGLHRVGTVRMGKHGMEVRDPDRPS